MSVPALRFKEFEESWKKRPLSQIVGRLESGVSVNSLDEPITSSHDYGILKTSCISNGSFNAQENKKIIEEDITRAKLNPAKDSILVSRMNTPQLVGEVGYISCDYPNLFIPDRLWLIQTRDKLIDSAKWLNYQLTTPKLKNALTSIATGTSGSMKNIAQPSFLNLEVHTPALQEQAKIANFLTAVDEKIQLLTQKHDLLTQYKKGVMQQIFRQELRFKDDDGGEFLDWNQQTISNVIDNYGGTALEEFVSNEGAYHFISIGNYEKNGNYFDNGQRVSLNAKTKQKLLNKGDLVMVLNDKTLAGDLIGSTLLIKENNKFIYNQRSERLVCNMQLVEPGYIWQLFNSTRFRKEIFSISQGGTQIYVNFPAVKKLIIPVPSLKEQTKIANFLTAIDDKITATQAQLDAVKKYKQGLLQQMFV